MTGAPPKPSDCQKPLPGAPVIGFSDVLGSPIHIISLGAGVQSSAMALMAALGTLTPLPEAAIFADTGDEPKSVYVWLDWLEKQLPFPVYRVRHPSGNPLSVASLHVRKSAGGKYYTKHSPPAFIVDAQGKTGILMRQCTQDFKLEVIRREIQRIRNKRPVIQWIGISLDEAHRMKPSRQAYITNTWPLIDQRLTRRQCLSWMEANGFPKPPRSACTFCPYHSNAEWQRLKTDEPEAFQSAVEYEIKLQNTMKQVTNVRGTPFLHRSAISLATVDFLDAHDGQQDLFGNECEGMCGV